ncbi:type II and III secretion system protein family protein [Stakelama sediminis]|uniref:Pilus assembly protein CpaC n=1 Tax=Stakelama sediminis TaxID=463200 RepID=A0A840YVG1_9SPHN|nr:type II and III secretion system protein family protein [Stakelama sediminis]MBB5717524.1 pilus assembly protein CpaC [Stakelama sediminis]
MRLKANKLTMAFALTASLATVAVATAPGVAQTLPEPGTTVELNLGQGRLVNLATPVSNVFVADDKVADVQVQSPTKVYIFAKGPGETNVYATAKSGKVVYATSVRVGQNITSVQSMLGLAMPDAQIRATTMNGLVLLTGTVASPDDAAEAKQLVQAFVGDKTKVITRLKTATPLQVNLQVKFAEVSRSFIKNIGMNLTSQDTSNGFQFGIAQGTQGTFDGIGGGASQPQLPMGQYGTTLGAAGKLLGLNILGALNLGERDGQVTTLNTTNLSALSGETGSFLAGGEIPIPVSQGLGAVSVEYKQYGVSLSYTPTVLADGRISIRVRPEVSQLSDAGAVTISGTTIPALTTRRAETTVEVGSGQSFMIAGLLSNNHQNSIDKAPGLGDIPILGTLFRSNGFQRNETELVIVITPYLVKPVNANQIALPTDGYKAPTDLQRVLMGQLSSGNSASRPTPTMAPQDSPAPSLGAAAALPAGPDLPGDRNKKKKSQDADKPTALPAQRQDGKSAMPGFSQP